MGNKKPDRMLAHCQRWTREGALSRVASARRVSCEGDSPTGGWRADSNPDGLRVRAPWPGGDRGVLDAGARPGCEPPPTRIARLSASTIERRVASSPPGGWGQPTPIVLLVRPPAVRALGARPSGVGREQPGVCRGVVPPRALRALRARNGLARGLGRRREPREPRPRARAGRSTRRSQAESPSSMST
jgi:hypothetical protein